MSGLPGFVVVGQEDWDIVWRRNQFLIAGLARRFPATPFLFVELPCDLTYGLRSGQLFRRGSAVRSKVAQARQGLRRLPDLPNVALLTPPKVLPDAWRAGEQINAALQAGVIRRALGRLGIARPILWTQNPFAAPLLGRLGERAVVYDVTDDWTALPGVTGRFRARVVAGDAALSVRAACVIACSPTLYTQQRARNAMTVLIPNGVDVAHYAQVGVAGAPVALRMAALPPPVLGYTGSLHEARLDLDLIGALAAARPDASLAFIGPNFLSPAAQARLEQFPNIHLLGPVPYAALPAYLHGCTALMIPHVVSPFTESLNPIKAFEYLAAGLPVVATAVAGVREYADLFRVADSPSAFIAAVGAVLADPGGYDRARARRLAQAAHWDGRVAAVLAALNTMLVGPTIRESVVTPRAI